MNDKYLKESIDILNRKFGDPLPTLEDTMKWHKEQKLKELKFGSKAQYDKYKKDHNIKPGTEIEIGGKKSVEKGKAKPNKKIDKQMSKAADDANEKMAMADVPSIRIKQITNADPDVITSDHIAKTHKALKKAGSNKADEFKKLGDAYAQAEKDRNKEYRKYYKKDEPNDSESNKKARKAFEDGDDKRTKVGSEMQKLLGKKDLNKRVNFQREGTLMENPVVAAAVAAAMQQQSISNPKTKNKIKLSTAIKSKDSAIAEPAKKKAKSIIQRIKDKFKGKEKSEPKKQSKSDAAFYKRQFTGEVQEGPDDVRFARRAMSKIAKHEASLRKAMFELEQAFLRDPRPENQKLAKEIKKAYKSNVTGFMKDSVQMIKRMK